MRVAIIGNYPWNGTQIKGGVQAAFSYLVKGLNQIDDLQVHILTMTSNQSLLGEQKFKNGTTLHLLPTLPRFEFVRGYRNYQSYLRNTLNQIRPDVVHAQDATEHAYSALKVGYPTVITVHGIRKEDSRHIGSIVKQARNQLHSRLIEKYCLTHTKHLIAISKYVTDYFSSQLRPDAKIYYVPNAIDESFFDLSNTSNGQTILFAGRVIPRKRVMDLVQAFAGISGQCGSAQLRIAGECTSVTSYVESIKQFVRKANLEDRVHLLGALPEDAILREFAGCDALVLPSIQETAPMVIAQAMAAGKPVVATRVGGVPEMISDGETGFLVDVGDILGLAKYILRLMQVPSLRSRMGQSGADFAMKNYHADVVARRTFNVYQQIAATKRR